MECLGYITTSNIEEARKIGTALVDKKLAACANILPGMESIYRWEGKIENATECILIVKTGDTCQDEVVKLVESMHSYDTPCVLWIPIQGGAEKYLEWLRSNLKSR